MASNASEKSTNTTRVYRLFSHNWGQYCISPKKCLSVVFCTEIMFFLKNILNHNIGTILMKGSNNI